MQDTKQQTVTILGVNGRIGLAAAQAFLDAGWRVIGAGRGNRAQLTGMEFVECDVNDPAALRRAITPADVVVNALNLPYDKWGNGAAEALLAKVIAAMRGSKKTMMFPGNIYNYAAKTHVLTPDTPFAPAREKGEIRVRMEQMLQDAAVDGLKMVVLRAPDFFGPFANQTNFDLAILNRLEKGIVYYPGPLALGHSWAYLPDYGRAFEVLAARRDALADYEAFHFKGHFATGHETMALVSKAIPFKTTQKPLPWWMLNLVGVFVPVVRAVVQMRYLWNEPHRLEDERLDAILGPEFLTPYDEAVTRTVQSYLPKNQAAMAIKPDVKAA